jgi:hypothetical protein
MPTQATRITQAQILELQCRLDDINDQLAAATAACEEITVAADKLAEDEPAWIYVSMQVRSARDVLPGGSSEVDLAEAIRDLDLARQLMELAERRSSGALQE